MAYRGMSFGMGMGMTPWVKRLMILNGVIMLLQYLTGGGGPVASPIAHYFAFVPSQVLFTPWTLLTYMFVHGDFWHLFWNMLGLFFFGPPLEARWGSREFLKYYLICGLGGAALSFVLAPSSPIIGASAGVYGIMLAFAMNWPDMPIYIWGIFPIPAKYLVALLALVSFLSMRTGGGNIAHAAHLGGFAAGFLYLKLDRPGGLLSRFKQRKQKRRLHVVTGEKEERRPAAPAVEPTNAQRRSAAREEGLLDELDRVLDKISTNGIASLTAEERKLLDDVSRRYRQN